MPGWGSLTSVPTAPPPSPSTPPPSRTPSALSSSPCSSVPPRPLRTPVTDTPAQTPDTRSQPPDTDTPRGPSSTSPPSLPIWPPHKRSTPRRNKSSGTPLLDQTIKLASNPRRNPSESSFLNLKLDQLFKATKNPQFHMWRTLSYPVELLSAGSVTHFGPAAFFRQYRFEFRNQIPKTFLATRATNFKLKS